MIDRRPRSGFWIVFTHVGTSGFAMPILFCLIASPSFKKDAEVLCLVWFAELSGSIVGTLCSLSNLRKIASYSRWTRLVMPSSTTFCLVLAATFALTLVGRILSMKLPISTFFLALAGLCITAVIPFSYITAARFAMFENEDRDQIGDQ